MKYDFLVFDLDGTLVDSIKDLTTAANFLRKDYGFEPLSADIVQSYVGNGVRVIVEKAVPDTRGETIEQAVERFNGYYEKCLLDETRPFDGIEEMLKDLQTVKKAILSNKPEKFSKMIVEGLGWSKYFTEIFGGDSVKGYRKPDPKVFFELVKKAGANLSKSIMLGDGVNDIKIAKAAGVKSLAVLYGFTDAKTLQELKPDYTVQKASEIKNIINNNDNGFLAGGAKR
ncbi:MAG: HAD-IA family hydrolase [Elusimicrobiota bacterium]|jgi:phosphoglycolate phosphatase|nr:HAD-IA family hydrolase [Elusimicrobiota bacterium]